MKQFFRLSLSLLLKNIFITIGSALLLIAWLLEKKQVKKFEAELTVLKKETSQYRYNESLHQLLKVQSTVLASQALYKLQMPMDTTAIAQLSSYSLYSLANQLVWLSLCRQSLAIMGESNPDFERIDKDLIDMRAEILDALKKRDFSGMLQLKSKYEKPYETWMPHSGISAANRHNDIRELHIKSSKWYNWFYVIGTILIIIQKLVDTYRKEDKQIVQVK